MADDDNLQATAARMLAVPRAHDSYPRCPVCGRGLRLWISGPNLEGNMETTWRCVKACVPWADLPILTPDQLAANADARACSSCGTLHEYLYCGEICAEDGPAAEDPLRAKAGLA